jgi:hypothetical protein
VAGVPHQELEQRELARPQVERRTGARHLARQQIQADVGHGQRGRFGRTRRAPDQRLHARQQLGERERLGEVVVSSRLQTVDPVVDRAAGAENQHRRRHAARAQRLDQRQPVALRQHEVDDRDVVRLLQRGRQPGLAVGDVIDRKSRLAQSTHHEFGNRRVVFDKKNPHGSMIPVPRRSRSATALAERRHDRVARRL